MITGCWQAWWLKLLKKRETLHSMQTFQIKYQILHLWLRTPQCWLLGEISAPNSHPKSVEPTCPVCLKFMGCPIWDLSIRGRLQIIIIFTIRAGKVWGGRLWQVLGGMTDTLAEVPVRPHMKRRAGSKTLPPSRLAGQHYWGPLITGATLRLTDWLIEQNNSGT